MIEKIPAVAGQASEREDIEKGHSRNQPCAGGVFGGIGWAVINHAAESIFSSSKTSGLRFDKGIPKRFDTRLQCFIGNLR
jgi:hypothetical protein